jgi:AcrR family transcriptional regulator
MKVRQAGKIETRNKVLGAARVLFVDPGYERTTIRMIAQLGKVSVGSVFTTFASKEDILAAIVFERYDGLAKRLNATLAEATGSARETMKIAFAAAYDYDFDRHAMLMHQISATWTWSAEMEAGSQAAIAAPFGFVFALLREAQTSGEIGETADLAVLGDMLMGTYLRGWRAGWFKKLDPEGMAAFAAPQIDVILNGAR